MIYRGLQIILFRRSLPRYRRKAWLIFVGRNRGGYYHLPSVPCTYCGRVIVSGLCDKNRNFPVEETVKSRVCDGVNILEPKLRSARKENNFGSSNISEQCNEKNSIKLILLYIAVDLHRSKALISLVPFNLHFDCFQG